MKIFVHDYAGHPFQVDLSRELALRGHEVSHAYFHGDLGPKGKLERSSSDPDGLSFTGVKLARPYDKASFVRRRFDDVSYDVGPGISTPVAARGCAFGDFDNDGDLDVVVNTVNDFPQLLRCDSHTGNRWLKVKTIGTKSNRSGIGARLKCVTHVPGEKSLHSQIDEVRSGGGYFSQNDLRIHFGIGKAEKVEILEIRWPSGLVETLRDIKPNQLIFVKEGEGIIRTVSFDPPKSSKP